MFDVKEHPQRARRRASTRQPSGPKASLTTSKTDAFRLRMSGETQEHGCDVGSDTREAAGVDRVPFLGRGGVRMRWTTSLEAEEAPK